MSSPTSWFDRIAVALAKQGHPNRAHWHKAEFTGIRCGAGLDEPGAAPLPTTPLFGALSIPLALPLVDALPIAKDHNIDWLFLSSDHPDHISSDPNMAGQWINLHYPDQPEPLYRSASTPNHTGSDAHTFTLGTTHHDGYDIPLIRTDHHVFVTIGRLRAGRMSNLSTLVDAFIPADGPYHGETALLHTAIQLISARLAGARRLMIEPPRDMPAPAAFSASARQIALLRHETGLDQVTDFLSGSPLVPTLLGTTGTEPPLQKPHLPGASGAPNYLRGPYETMYLTRPWTIRQYAGFSTAAESNAFYRKNLAAGQKGLSVAFDLPTHRGYDSDHPAAIADVGKAGVAIDTVEDMKSLFDGIPLDRMSVSMTMNGAVVPIMAFYIVAAEETGVAMRDLSGTIQNDILKEFMVRNTYIYPPEASLRLTGDVMAFTSAHMPRFNSISVSGYHMHEAGAPAALELAYTLANGAAYLEEAIGRGLHVDEVAPRISFFWAIGMRTLTEIAKLRAARVLWHEIVAKYQPNNPKSTALRTHCQTSGWSLTAQDPVNNITRTAFEALSAALGHTQSLHTNALDEAIALPTVETARIARQTQQYLIEHAGLTDMIDPLGGSHVLEAETASLIEAARGYIEEVAERGGMAKAIALGIPKRRIEEAATEKQARIDQGVEVIIGVNAYRSNTPEVRPALRIDHETVFAYQQERLQAVKDKRNLEAVSAALEQLTHAFSSGENVLPAAIAAARVRATLGEISEAIERVAGRHLAHNEPVRGVFAKAMQEDHAYHTIHAQAADFETKSGRRPRILVAKLGQDGHDRGARIIASSFADMGFDVDVGPLFQTPADVVRQAVDNDVHLIGISSLAGAHRTLVPEVLERLAQLERRDIRVIVGGVIPPEDYPELNAAGVAAVFGPGTNLIEAASALLELLSD